MLKNGLPLFFIIFSLSTATGTNYFNSQPFNTSLWDTTRIWSGDGVLRQIDIGNHLKGSNDDTFRIFTVQSADPRFALLFTDTSSASPMKWRCEIMDVGLNSYYGARIGDVDRDGKNDLIYARYNSPFYLFRCRWLGSYWITDTIAPINGSNLGMDVGDANNDGYADEIIFSAGLTANSHLYRAHWNGSAWDISQIWAGDGRSIYGVAIGNFDTANGDSNEIVAVTWGTINDGGRAVRIRWNGSIWDTLTLWKAPDSVSFTEVAIGDFDASNPGQEIAAANYLSNGSMVRGAVIEIYGSGTSWSHRAIYTPSILTNAWGIAIGDVINTNPGGEVVFANSLGPPYEVRAIYGTGSNWSSDVIFNIGGPSYGIAIGEVNKYRTLNQEIAITGDNRVYETEQIRPIFDVGVTKIMAPFDTIDSGTVMNPACSTYNYGNTIVTYPVRMKIGASYDNVVQISTHVPGTSVYVNNFPAWTANQPGFQVASCSTELVDDDTTANDKRNDSVFVRVRDVGTEMILNPVSGNVLTPGQIITPQAKIRNYGNAVESFLTIFKITGPTAYSDTQTINGLLPDSLLDQSFIQSSPLAAGYYTMSCSTDLSGDMHNYNDQQTGDFLVMAEPSLLSPIHLSLINDNIPLFDWDDLAGANYYWIQVDNDNNFTSPELENNNITISQTEPTTPISDGHYYWHIRGGASGLWGPWSAVWEFDLDATAPNAPILLTPDSAATQVELNPAFEWTPVSFDLKKFTDLASSELDFPLVLYRIQLSPDSSFSMTLFDTVVSTTSLISPIMLEYSTVYYWHVRATDDASNIGPYSSRFVFATKAPPPASWIKMADIPDGASMKKPKSGSGMTGLDGKIYFLKASNTQDFHIYSPDNGIGTWTSDAMPLGDKSTGDGKKPKKGASISACNGAIYILRGNNTPGFWKFQVDSTAGETLGWKKLANIPTGTKNPKDASGLVAVTKNGSDYLFAMKGSKTDEFYFYNITNDTWAPTPTKPGIGVSIKLGYKKGSCLTWDGDSFVYVLKGNYGDFFKYNIYNDDWTELRRYDAKYFLNRDSKKKKPKDGAALVYHNDAVYMLKGGNTNELWKYEIAADTWFQMNPAELWDIPAGGGKKVKGGGSLTTLNGYFYVAKGANTSEFYRHVLPMGEAANNIFTIEGTTGMKLNIDESNFTIAPNPAVNFTLVRYRLPVAGPLEMKLYNITGTLVKCLTKANSSKAGVITIDTKEFSSGIYILRIDASQLKVTRKLVIQR